MTGQVVGSAEAPSATCLGALERFDVSVGKDVKLQLAPFLKHFLTAVLRASPPYLPAHPAPVNPLVLHSQPFHLGCEQGLFLDTRSQDPHFDNVT